MSYKHRQKSLPKGIGFKADKESDSCIKKVDGMKVKDGQAKDTAKKKIKDNSTDSDSY